MAHNHKSLKGHLIQTYHLLERFYFRPNKWSPDGERDLRLVRGHIPSLGSSNAWMAVLAPNRDHAFSPQDATFRRHKCDLLYNLVFQQLVSIHLDSPKSYTFFFWPFHSSLVSRPAIIPSPFPQSHATIMTILWMPSWLPRRPSPRATLNRMLWASFIKDPQRNGRLLM